MSPLIVDERNQSPTKMTIPFPAIILPHGGAIPDRFPPILSNSKPLLPPVPMEKLQLEHFSSESNFHFTYQSSEEWHTTNLH
jgi:hypothetical protein